MFSGGCAMPLPLLPQSVANSIGEEARKLNLVCVFAAYTGELGEWKGLRNIFYQFFAKQAERAVGKYRHPTDQRRPR
jgi:hypothetical protein